MVRARCKAAQSRASGLKSALAKLARQAEAVKNASAKSATGGGKGKGAAAAAAAAAAEAAARNTQPPDPLALTAVSRALHEAAARRGMLEVAPDAVLLLHRVLLVRSVLRRLRLLLLLLLLLLLPACLRCAPLPSLPVPSHRVPPPTPPLRAPHSPARLVAPCCLSLARARAARRRRCA